MEHCLGCRLRSSALLVLRLCAARAPSRRSSLTCQIPSKTTSSAALPGVFLACTHLPYRPSPCYLLHLSVACTSSTWNTTFCEPESVRVLVLRVAFFAEAAPFLAVHWIVCIVSPGVVHEAVKTGGTVRANFGRCGVLLGSCLTYQCSFPAQAARDYWSLLPCC